MHVALQFNLEIEEVEQAAQQLELWRRDTTSALILEVLQIFPAFGCCRHAYRVRRSGILATILYNRVCKSLSSQMVTCHTRRYMLFDNVMSSE